jgi:hypothetical protein
LPNCKLSVVVLTLNLGVELAGEPEARGYTSSKRRAAITFLPAFQP